MRVWGAADKPFSVEVFSCVEDHVALLKKVFDFDASTPRS